MSSGWAVKRKIRPERAVWSRLCGSDGDGGRSAGVAREPQWPVDPYLVLEPVAHPVVGGQRCADRHYPARVDARRENIHRHGHRVALLVEQQGGPGAGHELVREPAGEARGHLHAGDGGSGAGEDVVAAARPFWWHVQVLHVHFTSS